MTINKRAISTLQLCFLLLAIAPGCGTVQTGPVVVEIDTLKEENEVGGLEFSADGTRLIAMAGAYSRDAHVWDWRNQKIVNTLQNGSASPSVSTPGRASPDGAFWIHCGVPLTVWDARHWQVLTELSSPRSLTKGPVRNGSCQAVEFSPDGKTLIVLRNGYGTDEQPSIAAYRTAVWREEWLVSTSRFFLKNISFAPDGQSFAVGGEVRNVSLLSHPKTRPTFGDPPYADTGLIAIVGINARAITKTIPVPQTARRQSSQTVAWQASDNAIVFGATDGLRSYSAASGAQVAFIAAEFALEPTAAYLSPDGKFMIETGFGARGDATRVVDLRGGGHTVIREIPARPRAIAWSRDGKHFALGGAAASLGSVIPLFGLIWPANGKIVIYELR